MTCVTAIACGCGGACNAARGEGLAAKHVVGWVTLRPIKRVKTVSRVSLAVKSGTVAIFVISITENIIIGKVSIQ